MSNPVLSNLNTIGNFTTNSNESVVPESSNKPTKVKYDLISNAICLFNRELTQDAVDHFNSLLASRITDYDRYRCYLFLSSCHWKLKDFAASIRAIALAFLYSPPDQEALILQSYYELDCENNNSPFSNMTDVECLNKADELKTASSIYASSILLLYKGIKMSKNSSILKDLYFNIIGLLCSMNKIKLASLLTQESSENQNINNKDQLQLQNDLAVNFNLQSISSVNSNSKNQNVNNKDYQQFQNTAPVIAPTVQNTIKIANNQFENFQYYNAFELFSTIVDDTSIQRSEKIKIYKTMIRCVNIFNIEAEIEYTYKAFAYCDNLSEELELIDSLKLLCKKNPFSRLNDTLIPLNIDTISFDDKEDVIDKIIFLISHFESKCEKETSKKVLSQLEKILILINKENLLHYYQSLYGY